MTPYEEAMQAARNIALAVNRKLAIKRWADACRKMLAGS